MNKKFKRGYVEYNTYYKSYVIAIARVIQSNEFGKWDDIDEDEINRFSGYATEQLAIDELKNYFKVKEIIIN